MNIIEVDVGKIKLFSIGQQYNNNALVIHFVNLPNQKNKYIYYKIDDIEEEIPLVSDLFIASRPLMLHSGEVKAQIITRDENNSIIELTKNFTMRIQPSNYSGIGEDENYPDDPNIKNYYVKIDGKIQSMDELIALVQSKLDKGEFIGAQGPKGEKGDPGDVTEEYRNLASQIAQNASDAQKILDDTKEFSNQTKTELNQIKTDTSALKDEANTSAVNAKASEDKAKEYADNLQASTDDIGKLKEDLVANTKEDAKTKRSLSALWDLNNGISYRFETDSEKAYQKKVLSGAKLASVNKVGGKTIVMNQLIDPSKRDTASIEFDESTKHFKYENFSDIGNKYICKNINIIKGHKYYIFATDKARYVNLYFYGEGAKEVLSKDADAESVVKKILIATGSGINNLYFNRYNVLSENISYFDGCINLFDLTKMFGSGNEPTTPEEFEAMLPNDYYPYNEGELISMSVNDVVYTDTSSNQTSHPIPQSIQNLDGYGWSAGTAYNYVDFENKKYYKCVDKVDLSSLEWRYFNGIYYVELYKTQINEKNHILCNKYTSDDVNIQWNTPEGCITLYNQYVYIKDSSIDSNKDFKESLIDVVAYYSLQKPIVIDISELIGDTFQEPFEVKTGGSLTFKNTNGDGYRIAVPSDIQYTVELSEVNT